MCLSFSLKTKSIILKASAESFESQGFSMPALSGGYSLRTKDNFPGLLSSDLWDGPCAQTRLSEAGRELPLGFERRNELAVCYTN